MEPQEGEIFCTDDGDELRIQSIDEMNDDSQTFTVTAEDGKQYSISWDGDQWLGDPVAPDADEDAEDVFKETPIDEILTNDDEFSTGIE